MARIDFTWPRKEEREKCSSFANSLVCLFLKYGSTFPLSPAIMASFAASFSNSCLLILAFDVSGSWENAELPVAVSFRKAVDPNAKERPLSSAWRSEDTDKNFHHRGIRPAAHPFPSPLPASSFPALPPLPHRGQRET